MPTVKTKKPVDPANTMFRLASISKLFTWVSVMQLVEQGKLNLDTDINHYLDFQIRPAFNKPITLRNLMTHTGGFEEVVDDIILTDPRKAISLRDYLIPNQPHPAVPAGRDSGLLQLRRGVWPATSFSAPAASPSSNTSRSTSSRRWA